MSTETDLEMAEVRADLRAVAREVLAKAGPGEPVDWSVLARAGWTGLEVDPDLDGAGVTFAEVAVLLEELGRAAAATPYLGAAVLGGATLNRLAAGPTRDELLRSLAGGGAVPAAVLVDAADDGPGALAGVPPFRLVDGKLDGAAGFVPDAPGAGMLLLLATDGAGSPVVVALPPGTAGLGVTAQPVVDASRSLGLVRAEDVAVPRDAVLPFAGDPARAVSALLDRAALAVAIDSLGLGVAMLDATVAHATSREQFGRPIGSFQAVQHACADMLVQLTIARQLVTEAVAAVATGADDASAAVSMAKSYAGTVGVQVCGAAMQLHGGMGYTWESGIHVYLKRATLNRSLFGSVAAHRRRLAARFV
jgi:alkylation response protein AidB-like acyl-CoA dehydrogenase